MKKSTIKLEFDVEVRVSFVSYNNKKLDKDASTQIKSYIQNVLNNELDYIPLFVEKERSVKPKMECQHANE